MPVWTLLALIPAKLKNPVHDIVLATQDIVEKLMSDALLAFAPGLLDAVQIEVPPAFLKDLPTCSRGEKLWAIYKLSP